MPGDGPFRIQAFEIADQQQSEVPSPRQARTPDLVGIESLAQRLDVSIEIGLSRM